MRAVDGLLLLVQGAIGAGHLWVGAAGFVVHRQRTPAALMFAVALACVAWATFCTALAEVAWTEWRATLVLSPLLSGYGAPAMLIFVRRAVYPQRPKLRWPLALGAFGSAFALGALGSGPALAFVAGFRTGGGPAWHPWLSPLYLGHTLEMAGCLLLAVGVLARGVQQAQDRRFRRVAGWLLFALIIGLVGVLAFSVLPGALRWEVSTGLAPLVTMPTMLLGARALQAVAVRERQGWTPRVAAEQARVDSVVATIRGVAAAVQAALGEIRTAAALVAVPGEAPPAVVARGEAILRRAAEASGLLDRLQRFAVGEGAGRAGGPVELIGLLSRALPAGAGPVRVETPTGPLWVQAEEESLGRALRALVENAVEAQAERPGAAPVRLAVDRQDAAVVPADAVGAALDGAAAVRIDVVDAGPGMAAPVLARATDPFFSTRPGHAGLGLVDVLAAVRAAEAAFHLESGPEGTRATLWLRPAAVPARAPVAAAVAAGGLLVVDRDPARRELLELLLARRGAAVHGVGGLAEAGAVWSARGPAAGPDLLLCLAGLDPVAAAALARRARGAGRAVTALVPAGAPEPALPVGVTVLREPIGAAELVPLLLSRGRGAAGPG